MTASERRSSLVACSLVLLTPFVIFLKHHNYPLLTTEVLVAAVQIAAFGGVFGLSMLVLPAFLRVVVASGCIVMFVDLQMDWVESSVDGLAILLPTSLLLWPLRSYLGRILAFASGVMIVATLAVPPGVGTIHRQAYEMSEIRNPEAGSKLPTVLHIVLDEHIALGGIPNEFDRRNALRHRIERAYLALGFRVFTRAFSRHFTSPPSLSHLVNLSGGDRSFQFYDPEQKRVTDNAYFEAMSSRGYRIHVFQTDYIDFCRPAGEINFASCATYTLESLRSIESIQLEMREKARAILGVFAQRSLLLREARRRYIRFDQARNLGAFDLPTWPIPAVRMSSVSSMQLLPVLEQELLSSTNGSLYFVHLLIPHFPYAYDRDCRLRPIPEQWLTYRAPSLRPARNDRETRAERYPPYLEQVECTTRAITGMLRRLMANASFRDAVVIIHGDHGSRITTSTPNQPNMHRMSTADYMDGFSTLFAYRSPSTAAGLDSRSLALDEIMAGIVARGSLPDGTEWIQSQDVFITGGPGEPAIHQPMRWGRPSGPRSKLDAD